jgi:hypothetical protein
MQLSHYSSFPADIPIIAEDELFLIPFYDLTAVFKR